jgi:endonuclease/exonuclease/phosphatase (EEP) superfamily protein YafD
VAYPWRMLIPESGNFGIGVYSSLPDTEFVRFELDGYAAIDAQVGGGAWRFVAAHLVPPMSAALARQRNVQLVQLSEYVQEIDQPVVLAGDFNLTPFSPIFTEFAAESELTSALRGFGPGMTWPSFFPLLGIPIDQVFVSEEFAVADYFRAGDIGSDHFPIIVDMNRRRLRLDSR